MAIKGIFYVRVQVADLARSNGEVLGWKLNTDEHQVAGFAFGSGYLVILGEQYGGPEAKADTRSAQSAQTPGGLHVEVHVEDVDSEHARLKQLGLAVSDLCDQPWGERNFSFSDPDGHSWSYGQATGEHR